MMVREQVLVSATSKDPAAARDGPAQPIDESAYEKRCAYQRMLDGVFPRGAWCSVLKDIGGHTVSTHLAGLTGRVFCCDAKPSGTGRWQYKLLIDRWQATGPNREHPITLWTSGMTPITVAGDRWQADVVDESGHHTRFLRLDRDPPADWNLPSKRTRSILSNVYEPVLFPHGLVAEGSPQMVS
jgi:hypothetical protein